MARKLSYEDIRNLRFPDLALKLLNSLDSESNFNNFIRGLDNRASFSDSHPSDYKVLQNRISDAWAWLESHALIGFSTKNPMTDNWQRITAEGQAIRSNPEAVSKVWAAERLAGDLDPALTSARSNFALGDYETAAFAAMKAVEVAVREAASLPNEVLGVHLMRKAFSPKDGMLCDREAEGGEQQATADLFAGAIGAFKNPASHRTVKFDDPMEAAEVIQLADLLLRIISRTKTSQSSL